MHVRFEVALSGDASVLGRLSQTVSDDDYRIRKGQEAYLLTGTGLDVLADASLVADRAGELTTLLSGACQALLGVESTIKVGAVTEILPDGGVVISGLVAETVASTLPPSVQIGDEVTHPTDTAREWLILARTDPQLAHGLELWSRGTEWWNLWKVFELVEGSSEGVKGIVRRGWATRDQCQRFARTANSRTALGVSSRHAFDRATPPGKPMDGEEAFHFVASLFGKWAASRQTSRGSHGNGRSNGAAYCSR